MAFVQIMSYSTTKREAMDAAVHRWMQDTEDVRRARKRLVLQDRDVPGRYVEVVFFDSYEDAMHNSRLPATGILSKELGALVDAGFEFQNLNVERDEL